MNKDNKEGLDHKRHTLAHLLAAAVLELWPDTKHAIGPTVDDGFYYDFEFTKPIGEEDLEKIEAKMQELLPTWGSFDYSEMSPDEAKKEYEDNPYKLELIDEIAGKGEQVTFYACAGFSDLCRGGHNENPAKDIKPDSFKLDRLSGAYWRGSEENQMLTRIYGLAFDTKDELGDYRKQREEAIKRDHKKLGPALDLFTFSDLVGSGLPLWTPKGTLVRNLLDTFVWELRTEQGYVLVDIPHITKKDLYITSGHWDKFKDELFQIKTREGHEFVMKPMNCPHHTQIYARKLWSYRELPQRYASTTKCYRDEQSGELAGISRTRSLTQDDAHVFCRTSQVKEEFLKIWDIVHEFYGAFGFEIEVWLSRHDPEKMENYLGEEKSWEEAESVLEAIAKEKGVDYVDAPGEAAFYGPKLDFMAKDSLGREWQVATIQLDMNMPERFDLTCVNEKGEKERIVMIHAAIMGSIERFLSILIEHTAGSLPTWLAPVQVKVLPIGEAHMDFAKEVVASLQDEGLRAELDDSDESLGKKIRNWKLEKAPYAVVLGDKEVADKKLTIESRDGDDKENLSVDEFITKLKKEVGEKK
ncbi:MAG: threonine--tRNA ligase [Patescibacteria group bacterium]|nr:threonine--tRNA ligase [Patescibacteria group bacterium]